MITKEEAFEILTSMTKSESLLHHSKSVELVMREYASFFNEDEDKWAICGMLHDADYEMYPTEHPNKIVQILHEKGEDEIAYAISAHYTKWGNPANSLMDKALLASDELCGFIIACSKVRPDGISTLSPKSVNKRLKNAKFAAKVEREEINRGMALLGVEKNEHIQFIIKVLQKYKDELNI